MTNQREKLQKMRGLLETIERRTSDNGKIEEIEILSQEDIIEIVNLNGKMRRRKVRRRKTTKVMTRKRKKNQVKFKTKNARIMFHRPQLNPRIKPTIKSHKLKIKRHLQRITQIKNLDQTADE